MKKKMTKRKASRRRKRGTRNKCSVNFAIALRKLKAMNQLQRNSALKMANAAFIRQFTNQVKKLKYARLSPTLSSRIRRRSPEIRRFLSKKTSSSDKKKMLTKRGGFLPLLMAALPALGSIIGGVVSRV